MSDVESDLHKAKSLVSELRRANLSRLPPEVKLAEQLNLSRSRLRTVLRVMEQEGLIWRHVGKGTFIGRRVDAGTQSIKVASPSEVFEARLALEPQIAALAAVRATERQIDDLKTCLDMMCALTDYEQWKEHDERLHRLVGVAAGNTVLLSMLDKIHSLTINGLQIRASRVFVGDRLPYVNAEHIAYVKAIEERDPELAEQRMREHILSVRSFLFGRKGT